MLEIPTKTHPKEGVRYPGRPIRCMCGARSVRGKGVDAEEG